MEKDLWEKTKVTLSSCSHRVKDFCKKYNLNPNDKEGCSFIMLMEMLAPNGTTIGVLKEGVFFDGIYSNIRKVLIENYNVKKIISIDSKAFENTTTKTSIIVFSNTEEKTSKIDFFNLVVDKEEGDVFGQTDNGYIILTKNKGDIIEVTDTQTASASIEKIRNKDYSLNFKVYEKSKIKCNEGYHFEKIGDLIDNKKIIIEKKSKFKASDGKNDGKYNFYTSSNNIKKSDIISYIYEYLLIGTGGNSCLHYAKNFSCSGDMIILKSDYNIFLYFLFKAFWDNFIYFMNGTTIKHVTKELLYNYSIPIPNDPSKIEYWSNKIGLQFDLMNSSKKEIDDIEKRVIEEIQRICDYEECIEKSIDKLCDINYGTRITKNNNISGNIPVYGGGDITFTTNKLPNRTGFNILISRFGMSEKCIRLKYNDLYLNDNGLTLDINNINVKKYIGYYLLNKNLDIFHLGNKTIIKALDMNLFKNYKIKLPKNTELINNLQHDFDRLEELHEINKNSKTLFETLISELRNEAVSDCENDLIDEEININPEIVDDKSSVSSKSSKTKSNKSELLEEILYNPVKVNVETFAEIKKRLNNGNDIKIKCPCNNSIIFQSNHWDEHRKLDVHKDYLKQYFTVEEKKKSSKKIQVL